MFICSKHLSSVFIWYKRGHISYYIKTGEYSPNTIKKGRKLCTAHDGLKMLSFKLFVTGILELLLTQLTTQYFTEWKTGLDSHTALNWFKSCLKDRSNVVSLSLHASLRSNLALSLNKYADK